VLHRPIETDRLIRFGPETCRLLKSYSAASQFDLPQWAASRPLVCPGSLLENDAISVRVFECHALTIPVGIKCWDWIEARISHFLDSRFPFVRIRKVEDKQVFRRRRATSYVSACPRKFKVGWRILSPEHYPVKTLMVLETVEQREP
jgi:hypothetical protein